MQSQGYNQQLTLLGYAYPNDDFDGDGLTDGQELLLGTDSTVLDSNCDGTPDNQHYPPYGLPDSDPMFPDFCNPSDLATTITEVSPGLVQIEIGNLGVQNSDNATLDLVFTNNLFPDVQGVNRYWSYYIVIDYPQECSIMGSNVCASALSTSSCSVQVTCAIPQISPTGQSWISQFLLGTEGFPSELTLNADLTPGPSVPDIPQANDDAVDTNLDTVIILGCPGCDNPDLPSES